MRTPTAVVVSVLRWPVESQHGSRRNALLAATSLTQARHERDEVERFIAAAERRHGVRRRHQVAVTQPTANVI